MDASRTVNILHALIDGLEARIERAVAKGISGSRIGRKFSKDPPRPTEASEPVRQRPARREKTCSVADCRRPARARGMCSKHYQRARYAERRRGLAQGSNVSLRGSGVCSHEGCEEAVYAKQMCSRHFMAWVRSRRKTDD